MQGDLPGSTYWDDRTHVAESLATIPVPPTVDAHLVLGNHGRLFHIPLNQYHDLFQDILEFSYSHHDSDFAWQSLDFKQAFSIPSTAAIFPKIGARPFVKSSTKYSIGAYSIGAYSMVSMQGCLFIAAAPTGLQRPSSR